jgi:outer membrane protein insertion porin family
MYLKYILVITVVLLFSSCSAVKYLKPTESLLFSQKITGNKLIKTDELEAFFRQKPNRRFLKLPFNPYIPIYFEGKRRYDKKKEQDIIELGRIEESYDIKLNNEELTSAERQILIAEREKKTSKLRLRIREGNWLMRAVGEKPVLFDSLSMHKTASQLKLFLQQKGFFHATATAKYETKNKRTKVVYTVAENEMTRIRQISYKIPDSTIYKIILNDTLNRKFQTKRRYDESKLETERVRIARKLKDEGYFDFSKQFIFFEVDTINPPPQNLDIRVLIENPILQQEHKRWEIDDVIMTSDVNITSNKVARSNEMYDNVLFRAYEHRYSNKILSRKIHIRPNQFYNQTFAENTQRSLALLEMFKFVNMKYDTIGNKLRANIYASPALKYSFTVEGGAELNLNQAIPGPFGSFSFRNLNTFGGCEVLSFRMQASLEAQGTISGEQNFYQSQIFNTNTSIVFPRVIFPMPNSLRKKIEIYNPTTRLQIGFQYVSRPEFQRINYQTIFGYNWASQQKRFFSINIADLNIVRTPFISEDTKRILEEQFLRGNNFKFSFISAFVSSITFSYTYNTFSPAKRENSTFFRIFFESGGTTLNLLSKSFLKENPYIFGDLRYYRFLKTQTDFRYYIPYTNKATLAFRFNLGLSTPYGTTPDNFPAVLPFEKYFFGGGSNSVRGWAPQRLGVGGYLEPNVAKGDGTPNYDFIRYGEMLLETSVELRLKLFSFVHGAAFIDAGNTWMLSDEPFPNSRFNFNSFYNQIAVGYGLGLRFDFSFLILRFDVGTKLVEPGVYDIATLRRLNLPDNFKKKPLSERGFWEKSGIYFGIGYPF